MLTSWFKHNFHQKRKEVCIKRSIPASCTLRGEGTKLITVKWSILGLQLRDMAAMLVVNTIKIILKNLHENGV